MSKINLKNYNEYSKSLDISKLPKYLQDGHNSVIEDSDLYDEVPEIKQAIDNHFSLLEDYIEKNKQSTPAKQKKSYTKPKVEKSQKPKEKAKKEPKPKKEKAKKEPKPKKEKAPKKDKTVGKPDWYKTIETYLRMANASKPAWIVRNFLKMMQDRFNAKKGQNTPHITKIRAIQQNVVDTINENVNAKKYTVKDDAATLKELKELLKTITVDRKTKEKVEKISLSGFPKNIYKPDEIVRLARKKYIVYDINLDRQDGCWFYDLKNVETQKIIYNVGEWEIKRDIIKKTNRKTKEKVDKISLSGVKPKPKRKRLTHKKVTSTRPISKKKSKR